MSMLNLFEKKYYGIVSTPISHSHSSRFPQYGQLQSQFSNAVPHVVHLVYSAKSSLMLINTLQN